MSLKWKSKRYQGCDLTYLEAEVEKGVYVIEKDDLYGQYKYYVGFGDNDDEDSGELGEYDTLEGAKRVCEKHANGEV